MLNGILKSIEVLNPRSDYWFVRTDSGKYFNAFFDHSFVGIGWNVITLADLEKPESEVKSKIYRTKKLDQKVIQDKKKATDIYNKLTRFKHLRKDDVIVIPSENSNYLAFGLIDDEYIYEDNNENFDCPYVKRRKIKWISNAPKPFESVDDIFYKIRKSRHAISNINEYADHVDSAMYSVFKKEDKSHFVINVKKRDDINWPKLASTLMEMHDLVVEINNVFELKEEVNNGVIKIAIQSRGLFNLGHQGIALILLATALDATSCNDVKGNLNTEEKAKLEQFQQNNLHKLDSIKTKLSDMEVDL
jgi:restriction system protein